MVWRFAVLLLILLQAAAAQTIRLQPGVPRRFSIAPQSQPAVITGLTVAVPGGFSRLSINLEADVLSHDLTLWARFDRDVVVLDGAVTAADFSSQNIGSGREQINIISASSPPLQTGTYYVAIGVVTLNTAITGTISVGLEGASPNGTLIVSTFDFDAEGWTLNFPESDIPGANLGEPGAGINWLSGGGAPGGYINVTEPGLNEIESARNYLVAPPKFLGNLAAMTNPRIEFDYRHTAGPESIAVIVLRILGNGAAFVWHSTEPPTASWAHYSIPLRIGPGALDRTSGDATVAQALTNVVRIELSADQAIGTESNGIDNFALIGDMPPAPSRATPSAPVTSSFDSDSDGWGRNYPPVGIVGASMGDSHSTFVWSREGGTPGGAIEIREAGGAADDYFVAPPKFLGNVAALPNPRLEFDYRHVEPPFGQDPVVVRIVGAGSSFVRLEANPAPFGGYRHYRTPLAADFFLRESGTATFDQALAAVQRIEISAEQGTGAEVNTLDNVTLLSSTQPPVRPNLGFAPAGLSFAAVTGGSNPPAQTLRISSSGDTGGPTTGGPLTWTATVDPAATWLSLSAASGTTPTNVEVSVNIAGLSARTYTGTITITAVGAANTPQVVQVTLSVSAPPPVLPRIDAGGIVNAASLRGPVAAGSLAALFGLNFNAPAEGILAAFLPGTQTLPRVLNGIRVLIRDTSGAQIAEAPLLFASNRQINFQMPFEVAGRSSVLVVVDSNGLLSAAEAASIAPTAPGLFLFGVNRAVVQNEDFSLNTASNPSRKGGALFAYLTGQGEVTPSVPTGQVAPASPLSTATAPRSASIGGVNAPVLFLGLTPGLVGLLQANILVPEVAPSGEQILLVTIGGQTTNGGLVSIR